MVQRMRSDNFAGDFPQREREFKLESPAKWCGEQLSRAWSGGVRRRLGRANDNERND